MSVLRMRGVGAGGGAMRGGRGGDAGVGAILLAVARLLRGAPVTGDEPGSASRCPARPPAELRAALVWNMRAALNVAALQCQFEPTLLTVRNYNAILIDHSAELKGAFDTLTKYFARTARRKARARPRSTSSARAPIRASSTVGGAVDFCQTAAAIGRDAVFTPRGELRHARGQRMPRAAQQPGAVWRAALPRYIGYRPRRPCRGSTRSAGTRRASGRPRSAAPNWPPWPERRAVATARSLLRLQRLPPLRGGR